MNVTLILQIISAAMSLIPVAESTITGIKQLLATDPTVQAGFEAILAQTETADEATLALIANFQASLAPAPTPAPAPAPVAQP
jgi:hypothetical protein